MKSNNKIHNIKLKKLLDEIKVEESSTLVKEFSVDPLEITAVALSAPDIARVAADGIDFISKEIGTGDKTKTAEKFLALANEDLTNLKLRAVVKG